MSYVLFITGPTASGKTDFSIQIAQRLQGEIINADVGQFYTPLAIGTAKPDWKNMPVPHHLFDILDEPKDFNVVAYKKLLMQKIKEIEGKGKLPIVVGGSLFYLRSLLLPPKGEICTPGREKGEGGYEELQQIDPERAKKIHPNDTYRIQRALAIWQATGKKPSEFKPEFKPEFDFRIVFIDLPREILFERINKRTEIMFDEERRSPLSWVEEVKSLKGTAWEAFLKEKKLIGYPEIFDWLATGGSKEVLVEKIQQSTRNYAKRQVTFWKKFRTLLEDHASLIEGTGEREIKEVIGKVKEER